MPLDVICVVLNAKGSKRSGGGTVFDVRRC